MARLQGEKRVRGLERLKCFARPDGTEDAVPRSRTGPAIAIWRPDGFVCPSCRPSRRRLSVWPAGVNLSMQCRWQDADIAQQRRHWTLLAFLRFGAKLSAPKIWFADFIHLVRDVEDSASRFRWRLRPHRRRGPRSSKRRAWTVVARKIHWRWCREANGKVLECE